MLVLLFCFIGGLSAISRWGREGVESGEGSYFFQLLARSFYISDTNLKEPREGHILQSFCYGRVITFPSLHSQYPPPPSPLLISDKSLKVNVNILIGLSGIYEGTGAELKY